MKILLVGVELFHADGCTDRQAIETDTTKLIVAFRNFEKVPKSNLMGPLAGSRDAQFDNHSCTEYIYRQCDVL
jgi:hypothetical protein